MLYFGRASGISRGTFDSIATGGKSPEEKYDARSRGRTIPFIDGRRRFLVGASVSLQLPVSL